MILLKNYLTLHLGKMIWFIVSEYKVRFEILHADLFRAASDIHDSL